MREKDWQDVISFQKPSRTWKEQVRIQKPQRYIGCLQRTQANNLFLMKKIPIILLQVLSLCNTGITTKYQNDSSGRRYLTNTAIKCSLYVSAVYFSSTESWLHRGTEDYIQCLSRDFSWNYCQHCTYNLLAVWTFLMRLNSFWQKSRSLWVTGSSNSLICSFGGYSLYGINGIAWVWWPQ